MVILCFSVLSSARPFPVKQNPFEIYNKFYLEQMITTSWVKHFMVGDLSFEVFQRFLGQDVLYLKDYERASYIIALRFSSHDPRRAFFERYAKEAKEERLWELQQLKVAHYKVPHYKIPANAAYTHYLLDKATNGTLPEAVAALIPCDLLWEELGYYIQHHVKDAVHHPYKQWIVKYNDPSFQPLAHDLLQLEIGLLVQEPQLKLAAITAYKKAANFEVAFFQAAL